MKKKSKKNDNEILTECPECNNTIDIDDSDERQEFIRIKMTCTKCNWTDDIIVSK